MIYAAILFLAAVLALTIAAGHLLRRRERRLRAECERDGVLRLDSLRRKMGGGAE